MPERKITYEKVQQQAEMSLIVKAPSWQRLYIDSALALTDCLGRVDDIQALETKHVTAKGDALPALMADWLNALLKLFHTEKFVARRIVFDKFDGKTITATLTGETHDPLRHGLATEIKHLATSRISMGDGDQPEAHFFAKITIEKLSK